MQKEVVVIVLVEERLNSILTVDCSSENVFPESAKNSEQ